MGKGKGKPGKGQNAPFSDAALEQRYQKLLRDRWAAGKDTISRARYARQLGHTGGNREPPSNLPNLHRSVEAPRAKPKATPKVQRTPPPPPPKRRKSDPDASRPSEPAPASQVAQVEETSPAPVQAPQVLVPEPQAAQPDTTQPMAGAGGDAPVPPSPAPVEGPTLEPAQASNLDSSSIQAAQSKAPEEPWKQHRLRSPRRQLKFPPRKFLCHLRRLRRPHLPRQSPLRSCLLNFLTPQLLLYLTLRRLLPRRSQQQGRRRPLLTLPPGAFCPPALMTQIRWNQ